MRHEVQTLIPDPSDPDFDRRCRESFARQSLMATLGICIVEAAPGRVVLSVSQCRASAWRWSGAVSLLAWFTTPCHRWILRRRR